VDQIRTDQDFEHVREREPGCRSECDVRVVVMRPQVADQHPGPVPEASKIDERDPDSGGQPHDRRRPARETERVAEPGGAVVETRQRRDLDEIPRHAGAADRRQPTADPLRLDGRRQAGERIRADVTVRRLATSLRASSPAKTLLHRPSTGLLEGRVSSRPQALSGSFTSVKRSPCAAAEPARPPPSPRSTNAQPTAIAAPSSGPAM
jgi:hypothetical protein